MKKIKTIEKKYIVGVVLIFLGCLIVTSIIWGNRTFSVKTLNYISFKSSYGRHRQWNLFRLVHLGGTY
jgi:hypothetical protein